MPRPCKRRRICSMPRNLRFAPVGHENTEIVNMTLDEYEAIRLIDSLRMNQEECAKRMGVARTTAQSIYNNARMKIAECIVEGKELHINGGDYFLCEETVCECKHCCKRTKYEENK